MSSDDKWWITLMAISILVLIVLNECWQWEQILACDNQHDNLYHWVFNIFHGDFAKGD